MAQTLPKVAGVELNSEVKLEINTTPAEEEATYEDMTRAFKNIDRVINENVYNATYLSDGGFGSSTVTGAAMTISLTGDYIKDDPVCKYLDSIQYEIGSKRVTDIKMTRNGVELTANVTLTSIAISGGESTAQNAVSVTMSVNGKPTVKNVSEAV